MDKSDISFTKEILTEASKNLGVDFRKVELVYNSIIDYLIYLVKHTSTTSVFIPYLGIIYQKLDYLNKFIRLKSILKTDTQLKTAKEKKDKIEEHYNQLVINKYKGTSRHTQRELLKMKYYTDGKGIDEIEILQNG